MNLLVGIFPKCKMEETTNFFCDFAKERKVTCQNRKFCYFGKAMKVLHRNRKNG